MSHWRLHIKQQQFKESYIWLPWMVGPFLIFGMLVAMIVAPKQKAQKIPLENNQSVSEVIKLKRQLMYYENQISYLDIQVKDYQEELDQVWMDNDHYEESLSLAKEKLFKVLAHQKAVLSVLERQLKEEREINGELRKRLSLGGQESLARRPSSQLNKHY